MPPRMGNGQQPRKFVYRGAERTREDVESVANQSQYVRLYKDRYPRYTNKQGINRLRILPPTWEGLNHWAYPITIHYNVGPDNNAYLCLRMVNQRCPVCEERRALSRQGEAEAARSIAPMDGRVSWVIDCDKRQEGPKLWFPPAMKMEKVIASLCIDDDGSVINPDDPDNGYDISFQCDNPGQHAQYSAHKVARSPSPLSDNQRQQQDWLDFIMDHPAPDCLKFYTEAQLEEVLHGSAAIPSQEAESLRHRATSLRETDVDEETGEVYEEQGQGQGYEEAETDTEEDGGVPFDQEQEEQSVEPPPRQPRPTLRRVEPPSAHQTTASVGNRPGNATSAINSPGPSSTGRPQQQPPHRLRPPGMRPSSRT